MSTHKAQCLRRKFTHKQGEQTLSTNRRKQMSIHKQKMLSPLVKYFSWKRNNTEYQSRAHALTSFEFHPENQKAVPEECV